MGEVKSTTGISTLQFAKAIRSLKEALQLPKTDISRDEAIQRFAFTVELAWKTTKKHMGSSSTAPKEIVREMAQNKYISDIDFWLKAIDQRNLTSHTYNEEVADEVYSFAGKLLPEAEALLGRLVEP
jgi:nucleotidyltransferase substrate binding protein (TIGR01987 family)